MIAGARRREGVAGRLRPLAFQGPPLASFPARVEDALSGAAGAEARAVVVLAIDGLRSDVARGQWAPDELVELVTTVPSASMPAWLTAMTGAGVGEHLVAGMVFALPGCDGLLNAATTGHSSPGAGQLVRRSRTIFETAGSRGVEAVAYPGVLAGFPGPWLDALLAGAGRRPDAGAGERPPGARSLDGDALTEARVAIACVDATLGEHRGTPLLVWAYVDIDTAVHRRGYDREVLAATTELGEAAERWAAGGATVLAVSDHGLTPVEHDPEATAAWRALEHSPLCRLPAGGAGRMRWLYARPGSRQALLHDARAALDGLALVASPEELAEAGILDLTPDLRPRLGDAVAVATDPRFPVPGMASPGDARLGWEHGALTPEEMLVPCARWGGGDRGSRTGT